MRNTLYVYLLLVGIGVVVSIVNIGEWIDVSEKPHKSDVVICLGGGSIERVRKSVSLVNDGYVDKMFLLGESWYNQPYITQHYPKLSLTIDERPKNTQEEMCTIEKYMHKHHYGSAIIVTDPPHTRRVKLLASEVLKEDSNLSFYIVGTDVVWWNKYHYYKNMHAFNFVWHEVPKIVYRWIKG